MMLSAIAVPSVVMRVASHAGTRPPCSGRSATPERFTTLMLPRHIHAREIPGDRDLCPKRLRRVHHALQDVRGSGTGRGSWQSPCVQELVARVRIVHVRLAVADGVENDRPKRD